MAAPEERHQKNHARWLQDPNIPPILRRAIVAARQARYVGRRTVEFWHGDRPRVHEEIFMRQGNLTRVEFPDGSRDAGQVIVENRDERRHYNPGKNEILVQPPRHEESLMRLVRMAEKAANGKVQFSSAAGPRIAGYGTVQLTIADRNGNATQRIYIEPRTGVVLGRDVFDPGGARIGHFEFTQIDLNPPPFDPSLFKFDRRGARIVTPYDQLRDVAGRNGFPYVALSPSTGFKLDEVRVAHPQGQQVLVETYWSRRGKISLFELKSPVDPQRLQRFAGQDLHTYTWQAGGLSFVLVGALEPGDLAKLSQSTGP